MRALQTALYENPFNFETVKQAVASLRGVVADELIDHELILAFSLNFDLIEPFASLLTIRPIQNNQLVYHRDPLFLLKLKKMNILPEGAKIPQKYLDEGNDEEKEVHFGGNLAQIIRKDDDEEFNEIIESTDFEPNSMLTMADELYGYHQIPILNYAAQVGAMKCIRLLLDYGAEPGLMAKQYEAKWDAMGSAASRGNIEVLKLLHERGGTYNLHAVEAAGMFHQNEILKWLFVIPQCKPTWTKAAIFSCSKWNNLDGIEICLSHGGEVNCRNVDGQTPLHFAADKGHLETIRIILEKGANINAVDTFGRAPIHMAANHDYLTVIKFFVQNGAEIDVNDNESQTPLHLATEHGNIDIVNFLIQSGANVNATKSLGVSPLHIAAEKGFCDIAKALLENRANANLKKSIGGLTPLHVATSYNQIDMMKFLIGKGADLMAKTEIGQTALHLAAEKGYIEAAKVLIGAGIELDTKDNESRSPIFCAKTAGQEKMRAMLEQLEFKDTNFRVAWVWTYSK